jgi:WD40 repeat protein/mono/diheme cytochrome c family protein
VGVAHLRKRFRLRLTVPAATISTMLRLSLFLCLTLPAIASAEPERPVSFYKQVRPVFQAKCHGCHQPAKAKGELVMTSHAALLKGGHDGAAIQAGKPDESNLLKRLLLPREEKEAMPPKDGPLPEAELALIKRWITEGAADDTPSNAVAKYDAAHPPVYTLPPGINALDYSPDGALLAVAGFHEILLHKADGSGLVGRLIGLSDRITAVRFSPNGNLLAATGGLAARMGEVQIWEVATQKLLLSVPVTNDTIYGASWSPDGALVSFGCADTKSVRAIDAKTGEQKLFMASHDDWVFDTVFSAKGDHIVSVGRDMTTKLTEVATQRFVDNLTSITPGSLKGGLASIARHPARDEVLVGGADGMPQIYRMFRLVGRRIGDNSNLIKKYAPLTGRIFAVDYSRDGKRVAAGSSLDGQGQVKIYNADFDTALPDNIKGIYGKVGTSRSAEENAAVEKYVTDGATQLASLDIPTGVYTVRFNPDGTILAVAGQDGKIRLIDAGTGTVKSEFLPVTLSASGTVGVK